MIVFLKVNFGVVETGWTTSPFQQKGEMEAKPDKGEMLSGCGRSTEVWMDVLVSPRQWSLGVQVGG